MSKQKVVLGAQARKQLAKGINTLADAVISTLGPNGRNIIYEEEGKVYSTKDGVTVAKQIQQLDDPIENLGIKLIKQAAINTADKVGDGTTTSTLLAREIVQLGLQRLDEGGNATEIKKGIDSAVKSIISSLSNLAEDISDPQELINVATISGNNDEEIGNLVYEGLDTAGTNGVVHIEESKTGETYLEVVEGMQFDRGYKSHYFVTHNDSMTCNMNDVAVLIADHTFRNVKELLPILNHASSNNKSLLIICDDIEGEALATLIVNKMRGSLKVCAVKSPEFGDRKKLVLDDIAKLTGGEVFSVAKGMKLDKFDWSWMGSCRSVKVTKDKTTIIDGHGNEDVIKTHVESLQSQIDQSSTPFEVQALQDRLAKMTGGVSIIHVGGMTEAEMKERKDRVEDALFATKCAIEDGILPGGGRALHYISEYFEFTEDVSRDFNLGETFVKEAIMRPFETILSNAGKTDKDIDTIANSLLISDFWNGYNLKTEKVGDMKEYGIIDPFKVTKNALLNAASIAGTILLTEGTISVEEVEKDGEEVGVMPQMF